MTFGTAQAVSAQNANWGHQLASPVCCPCSFSAFRLAVCCSAVRLAVGFSAVRLFGFCFQRRRSESNRRVADLQSTALPLGYGALIALWPNSGRRVSVEDGRATGSEQATRPNSCSSATLVRLSELRGAADLWDFRGALTAGTLRKLRVLIRAEPQLRSRIIAEVKNPPLPFFIFLLFSAFLSILSFLSVPAVGRSQSPMRSKNSAPAP